MLSELFDKMLSSSAEAIKSHARKIETPGIKPGQYQLVVSTPNNASYVVTNSYELRQPTFETYSLLALRDFLYEAHPGLALVEESSKLMRSAAEAAAASEFKILSQWHVFVGNKDIQAYLIPRDGSSSFATSERVTLKLEATEEWDFASKTTEHNPIDLVRKIKRLFTGKPSMDKGSSMPSAYDIQLAGSIFSRIAVTQTERSTTSVSAGNETLGNDINRELVLGEHQMPEFLSIPVNKYKQLDMPCEVISMCHYDYEKKKIVITPINHYLIKASDDTNKEIVQQLDNPEATVPLVIASADINVCYGEANLR